MRYVQFTTLQPFNGLFSRKTWVSRYQKSKANLDFTGARDSEWLWHQLGRMQVCTSLQTDNHASTPPLCFFTGRMPFLPPNQQRQSTEGKSTEGAMFSLFRIKCSRTNMADKNKKKSNTTQSHMHTHTPKITNTLIHHTDTTMEKT